jgi:hypothetical protein
MPGPALSTSARGAVLGGGEPRRTARRIPMPQPKAGEDLGNNRFARPGGIDTSGMAPGVPVSARFIMQVSTREKAITSRWLDPSHSINLGISPRA